MKKMKNIKSRRARRFPAFRDGFAIELVVLNCCVIETNDTASASKSSTSRAKSASDRVSSPWLFWLERLTRKPEASAELSVRLIRNCPSRQRPNGRDRVDFRL
jgi:hypothetical protein